MNDYMENDCFESVDALFSNANGRKIDDIANLKITWNGKYGNEIYPELLIYNYTEEKRQVLKNTLTYISENFEKIYFNMLKAILPLAREWEMQNEKTGKKVLTIDDLNAAKLEKGFIESIQLNCADIKNDKTYYSIIFRINYYDYGYDDGMEVVFYEDKVIFWSDGNTGEYLLVFRSYEGDCKYFGE